jgi:two-component system response regulator AtoC
MPNDPSFPEVGNDGARSRSGARDAAPCVVLLEDEPDAQEALGRLLVAEGFSVEVAATLQDATRLVRTGRPSVVITDLRLPDGNGIEIVRSLRDAPEVEVVVITGHPSIETAVEALRLGAYDYLTKPVDIPHLKGVLGAIRRSLGLEALRPSADERGPGRFGRLVGVSDAMERTYVALSRVAPAEVSVLLTGESGTGKELAARTLHELSGRRDGPFVAVNCGAIPPNMVESELFGHERGSFTGASQRHSGYFERASGGTLFLDEIAEMPLEAQVRLLRVLESGVLLRVGGEKDVPVDVRVVAATNRRPEAAVVAGRLREDLYFRLAVVQIELPPLRDRLEDVPELALHFLNGLNVAAAGEKRLSPEALDALRRRPWLGNVRELRNAVQRAYIMADGVIGPEHLPPARRTDAPPPATAARVETPALRPVPQEASPPAPSDATGPLRIQVGSTAADAERSLFLATLDHCGGDKKEAARILCISVKTIYNRLRSYARDASTDDAGGDAAAGV